jgi:glycosyltransferase involved in cell wall biosynthesis
LSDPILSIVIPVYNIERYVAAAIASALAQTLREIEVVVIDDGSTDATASVAETFKDPRVRIERKSNGGLSSARNAGIAIARGRYIGFLDGDDMWRPAKAERQIAVMEADPTIGLTYSYSAYVEEDGTPTGRILFSTLTRPSIEQMVRRNHVGNGSTPIVRASCFRTAGVFDESLRICGDWEMWVRLLRDSGAAARLVPEVLTFYRMVPTSLSMNFAEFLHGCELAAARIKAETPQVSSNAVRRGIAMCYRIAGTKALHGGNRFEALRLIRRAVSLDPMLLVSDPRLAATLGLAAIPAAAWPTLHRLLGALLVRKGAKAI